MDKNTTVISYTFLTRDLPKDSIIQIRGSFPKAHYTSIYIYDGRKFIALDGFIDHRLTPDKDDESAYTVWIAPKSRKNLQVSNQLRYPDQLRKVTIVLRIYDTDGIFGATSTPDISAYHPGTGKTLPLPKSARFIPKDSKHLHQAMARRSAKYIQPIFRELNTESTLRSYRIRNLGIRLAEQFLSDDASNSAGK